jgi:hypothetical protein
MNLGSRVERETENSNVVFWLHTSSRSLASSPDDIVPYPPRERAIVYTDDG